MFNNILRIITVIVSILFAPSTFSQSWVSKTSKSIFTLTTFKEDGSLITSTTGFFTGSAGECISSLVPFKGASSAVVIDSKGKKYDVTGIIAGDDTYDICRFVCNNPKSVPLKIAESLPSTDENVFVLPYSIKNISPHAGKITMSQTFKSKYYYYTLNLKLPENAASAPLLNNNGEVFGIIHPGTDTLCYATDVKFAIEIMPEPLLSSSLSDTSIPVYLPSDLDQAMISLFVSQQKSKEIYEKTLSQFVRQFPDNPDGYIRKAQLAADRGEKGGISQLFERALSCATDKSSVHYDYSRIICTIASEVEDSTSQWNFERALKEIDQAIALSQQPLYQYQRAMVLIELERWREAVFALNEYEKNMPATALDADLYHMRFIAEQQSKMFKQAIDDITKAIELNPHSLLYHVEQTQLLIRLNLLDDALRAAEDIIATDASYADGYLLLGIIQYQKGNKEEGLLNLKLAQDKGSTQASAYIEKYQ